MAISAAAAKLYPGFEGFTEGPLKRTIEHNINMEEKYGIPPGANTGNPKYSDPNDFWKQASQKDNKRRHLKAA